MSGTDTEEQPGDISKGEVKIETMAFGIVGGNANCKMNCQVQNVLSTQIYKILHERGYFHANRLMVHNKVNCQDTHRMILECIVKLNYKVSLYMINKGILVPLLEILE